MIFKRKYILLFIGILLIFQSCKYDSILYSVWRAHFKNAYYTLSGAELRVAGKKDTLFVKNGKPQITAYSAVIQGEFVFVQDTIIQYGHCWSTTNPNPVITEDTFYFSRYYNWPYDSLGTFTSRLSLMPETPFYVRSYVINSKGDTGYFPVSYIDTTIPPINEWFKTQSLWNPVAGAAAFTMKDPFKGYECGFVVGGGNYSYVYNNVWEYDPTTGTWTELTQMPAALKNEVAFGIQRKDNNGNDKYEIYVGTGEDASGNIYDDFYRYNFLYGTWEQIAPFPQAVTGAVAFVIEDEAFVGLGRSANGIDGAYFFKLRTDLVDSLSQNVWYNTQPLGNDISAYRRSEAIAFVINNRAFVGLGYHITGNDTIYYDDLWMFIPPEGSQNGSWYKMADFPGGKRSGAVGLAIEDQGYVGLGFNGNTLYKDFYRFDPFNNKWYQIADYKIGPQYEGQPQYIRDAVGFGIENKGYVGLGITYDTVEAPYSNEFWIYRPW